MLNWLIITALIIFGCVQHTHLLRPSRCGNVQVNVNELIVHGHETVPGAWPWHTAIYHGNQMNGSYACGGTLISETFVLTAAHCVRDTKKDQLSTSLIFVRLGVHNLSAPGMFQQIAVEKIHQPNEITSKTFRNDIALLELATIAKFNDYVQPACISSARDVTGEFGTVVGWGLTEDDTYSSTLKSARMPVIDPIVCLMSNRAMYGVKLDSGIFCAGYTNGTSVCNGDSGGGIFFIKDNVWYVKGIVSFSAFRNRDGYKCDNKGYAGFTKVHPYLSWITSTTNLQFFIDGTVSGDSEPRNIEINRTYANLFPRNCGVYSTNRMLDEENSKVFEFPWMALFQYRNDTLYYYCTGTLINKRYVLTAAVRTSYVTPVKVILGEHTIDQDIDCNEMGNERECAPPVEEYGIECSITHQNFKGANQHWINNIALIRLDRDVVFKDHIQPVCLPTTPSLRVLNPPQYIATGWGSSDRLLALLKCRFIAVSRSECGDFLPRQRQLKNSQLCAREMCTQIFMEDQGIPLGYATTCNGMERFVQFGIISVEGRTTLELSPRPIVYTNVSFYMDWVIANMDP